MTDCQICWTLPAPASKHSYLIYLVDEVTNKGGYTIFQSSCPHGMQEWAQELAEHGNLVVVESLEDGAPSFNVTAPRVIMIDSEAAAHIPIVDPVN